MLKTEKDTKNFLRGVPVSEGIAIGRTLILKSPWDEVLCTELTKNKVEAEVKRYKDALREAAQQLEDCREHVKTEIGKEEAKIFEAHLSFLNDVFFQRDIIKAIRTERKNAEFLLKEGIQRLENDFSKIKSEHFRARLDDIRDVAVRLLRILHQSEEVQIPTGEAIILIAHNLTPSDTVHIDKRHILGFVTELGGTTSHTSILARSMGIPAVVGIERLMKLLKNGDGAIVDGNAGIVYINPPKEILDSYRKRKRQFGLYWERLSKVAALPAITADGVEVSLQANISMTSDVSMAVKYKADGIGLFRTELPFLITGRLLTEDEQFNIYKTVIHEMRGKTVTIRTLDLGGDKFLPYQGVEKENNPYLGWRSIRISLQERDVFKMQLRAILKASHFGKVRILFPMISSIEEIVEIKGVLEECRKELRKSSVPFDENMKVGIMVEVPSTAIMAERLIQFVDYFSIGTNDLIQYTLAVDRNNEKVAKFYQPLNPAILFLIHNTIKAALRAAKTVSLCGEMAGDPVYTALLLGFGLKEFSMSPLMIPEVKERIRVLSLKESEDLARRVLQMFSMEEIEHAVLEVHHKINRKQSVPYLNKMVPGKNTDVA